MNAIEIMAALYALAAIVKIVTFIFSPEGITRLTKSVLSKNLLWVYIPLGMITGYYLLQTLDIVTIAAVMLFCHILVGAALLSIEGMDKFMLKAVEHPRKIFNNLWPVMMVWLFLAFWVLFEVFM